MNGLSQERDARVRPLPLSNPNLQWASQQMCPLSKQGVVSQASAQPRLQELIWKLPCSSSFAPPISAMLSMPQHTIPVLSPLVFRFQVLFQTALKKILSPSYLYCLVFWFHFSRLLAFFMLKKLRKMSNMV